MNRKIIITLMAVVMLLGGCQLAVSEGAKEYGETLKDRMVGAFITEDYLDLFDMDAYLEDNIDKIVAGNSLTVLDNGNYTGRLYAEKVEASYTDETGAIYTNWTYEFPDLEGILYTNYWNQADDENSAYEQGYWSSKVSGLGLSELHSYYSVDDTQTTIKDEGTIYLSTAIEKVQRIYLNPVYQDEQGRLYVISGTGISANLSDTGSMAQSISSTSKHSMDGKEVAYAFEFNLRIEGINATDSVVVIRMDENHQELGRETYLPENLPEEIELPENVAYLLVEEHRGEKTVRSICQAGDAEMAVYYAMENGICVKESAKLNWGPSVY